MGHFLQLCKRLPEGKFAGEWTAKWMCIPPKIPKYIYPLVTNIAVENGPYIVDLPIKDGDFP